MGNIGISDSYLKCRHCKSVTKEYFLKKIQKHDYMLQRLCEHIILRPNDNKRFFGEDVFKSMIEAVEKRWKLKKIASSISITMT